MAGYQDLFSDPMAAIGYGLLTSRTNPLGEGVKLLQASDAARKEREYKDAILRLKAEKNALPKLQFNPVTGQMFDMRTGTPFNGGVQPTDNAPIQPSAQPAIPPEFANNPKAAQKYLESLAKAGGATAGEANKKAEGAARFEIALSDMEKNLEELKGSGNIVSTENAPLENLGLYISNSGIGQAIGGALGTERATNFENMQNLKPRLIAALAQATGQSSKSLDSNTELKLALDSLGSGSYESRKAAVDTIRKMFAKPDLLNQQTAPNASGGGAVIDFNDLPE